MFSRAHMMAVRAGARASNPNPTGWHMLAGTLAHYRFESQRDGKWVVYCSLESGRPEIYLQPCPGPDR
jgi:hypothetical protein